MFHFLNNRKAQVFSEYGLMIVIVVVIAALLGWFFRGEIKAMLTKAQTCSQSVINQSENGGCVQDGVVDYSTASYPNSDPSANTQGNQNTGQTDPNAGQTNTSGGAGGMWGSGSTRTGP